MSDLGRQVKYGLGIGADVAPAAWFNQLSFDLNPKVNYIDNVSAYGTIERTNNSDIDQQWAEGTASAKLTSDFTGYILLGAFGSVASTDNVDTDPTVKDHTFLINQNITGQPFTFYRKDSIATEKFTSARFGKWQLSMGLGKYMTYTADVMAKKGATTTATPVLTVDQPEFLTKHFSVKTAATESALSGASNITSVESFTLTVDPNLKADFFAGSSDPLSFSSNGYDMEFELKARYNDQTFHDAYINGTRLAIQVTALNSDVVIGAAAHPGLAISCPRIYITDWSRSEDLDKPLSQTMKGTIHFSPTDGRAIRAILTNTTSVYA